MPTHRNELRFPPYEDVPELCPVFVTFVDEKRYLGHCQDVSHTRESIWCHTFRFLVCGRIEDLAIVGKAHWHDLWSKLRIHGRKPRDPSVFQFCPNRGGNLLPVATGTFES
jgi:hypothetical protein